MNPVAFINVEERKLEWSGPVEWGTPTIAKIDKVPLYTHQYSELTDEEIMQIVEDSYMPQGMDKSRYTGFARAILRKAQEK